MKKISILFFVAFAILQSCEEATLDPVDGCIEVRVIDELCNQAVIQVVSPGSIDVELSSLEVDGVKYENVFKTFFHCQQMPHVPLDGTSFHIRLIDESTWQSHIETPNDCVWCEPLLAAGLPFSYVEIIDNCQAIGDR